MQCKLDKQILSSRHREKLALAGDDKLFVFLKVRVIGGRYRVEALI